MNGRTVTQDLNAQLLNSIEIQPPIPVMAALFQLVDTLTAALDGRITILNAGRKKKAAKHL
jgi:hypothetical protein